MQSWEQERLDRLRSGDRDAFAELVHESASLLYRIAYRLTRNADDAEDLVGETYLAAMGSIRRFEGRASLKTWLIRILVRLARRRPRPTGSPLEETFPAPGLSSDDSLALGQAVDRLHPKLREALILVKVGGLSYREAAEALKSPVGTIQFRVHTATQRLRRVLEIESPPIPSETAGLEVET